MKHFFVYLTSFGYSSLVGEVHHAKWMGLAPERKASVSILCMNSIDTWDDVRCVQYELGDKLRENGLRESMPHEGIR